MNAATRSRNWILLSLLVPMAAISQVAAPDPKNSPSGQVDLPSERVQFSPATPLPQVNASPVMQDPIHCAPDGAAFVDFVRPPDFRSHLIYSIDKPDRTVSFSPDQIPGISQVVLISYFPSESKVAFLVYAKPSEQAASDQQTHPGAYFIAIFDRDGKFDKLNKLDLPFAPHNLALFESGNMIVLGEDQTKRISRMALLDSTGVLIRFLDPQATISNESAQRGYGSGPGSAMISALSEAQFLPYGQSVLLVAHGTTLPVLVIGESGIDREVQVNLPKDQVIANFIPSTGPNWFMRSMQPDGANGLGKNFRVFEMDPQSGERTKSLEVGVFPGSIGCETDGAFTAYQYHDKQLMMRKAQE
jgi:hypothetical protein